MWNDGLELNLLQMFPENVLKVVRKFADDVINSLQFALKSVPDNLTYVKMKRKSGSLSFGTDTLVRMKSGRKEGTSSNS